MKWRSSRLLRTSVFCSFLRPKNCEKRAEVINHFSVIPHSSVFEAVRIAEDQPTEAIQKIMSAPLVVDRRVVGVIQISRKANSAPDAGPDFTHQQLRELRSE